MGLNRAISDTATFTKGFLASAFASAGMACVAATAADTLSRHLPDSLYVTTLAAGALAVGAAATLVQTLDRVFDKAVYAGIVAGSAAVAGAACTLMPRLL